MKQIAQIKDEAENAVATWRHRYEETAAHNHRKVLAAFRNHHVSYHHFQASTGYGMGDSGRDTLEAVWSEVFQAEDSLIRQQIVSGTHSITLALFAMLLPGDEIVFLGQPYDTLFKVLGRTEQEPGSLRELGVAIKFHPLTAWRELATTVSPRTKVLYIQRSKGYEYRRAHSIAEIAQIIALAKEINDELIVFVDNCYGEFVEKQEPLAVGADLIAGSLIKNAGGAIAPAGGYLAGRRDLIERAAYRLTAPGIGKEIGPSLLGNTSLYQGLYMAPPVVAEALAGTVYLASVFKSLGYDVLPGPADHRSDIVQAIKLNDPAKLKAFCQGIQRFSPVDSHVLLADWEMPGYEDKVIMASGGFVEGSSIELSADGPMRPPYIAFAQGGVSYHYIKAAIDSIIEEGWDIK